MSLAVVIPALNAAATLPRTLGCLAGESEIVVVDGGSTDGTPDIAVEFGARLISAPAGRGRQLAAGAEAAKADWLLFLHADTSLESGWRTVAQSHMAGPGNDSTAAVFRFALDDESTEARRLERLVEWRFRALALPYGDQGLLISRELYRSLGGFRALPLMEDVDFVRRIGRRRLVLLPASARTSAARWCKEGWRKRSLRNLACLSLYYLGVPARVLQRIYG